MLKRHAPGDRFWWWIDSRWKSLLEGDPDLDGIVLFERHKWSGPAHWPDAVRSLRAMQQQRFDCVLDLQALLRSSILGWFCRGAFRVGLDDRREGAPALYDVAVKRPVHSNHAVDWYLEVLRVFGAPVRWDYEWLPSFREEREQSLGRLESGGGRGLVLLQPGARWENKRWPIGHFQALASRLLHAHPGLQLAVIGSRNEQHLADSICAPFPGRAINLAGATSLRELVEWVRLANVLVTNDTGPMHVAAAVGTPVVALFGPTDPARTGPYGAGHVVSHVTLPCRPCLKDRCHHRPHVQCLTDLDPARIAVRVEEILAAKTGGSRRAAVG